ncbi:MAG: SpoIIE family protein phosphatase [Solobacterium sp.]|nr:SpoIIE family protein phosphatase [Solobacterium sp.]
MRTAIAAALLMGSLFTSNIPTHAMAEPKEMAAPFFSVRSSDGEGNIVDPIGESERYSAVIYNNRNGLPTSEANEIAETSDGFIWIGSYSGLVRYDGNTFERMDSTTGIANVGSLFVDSKDRLWVGTNDSGVAMIEQGRTRMWKEEDGLNSLNISMIAEDDDGVIYVSTTSGVYLIDEDLQLTPVEDPRLQGMYVDVLRMGNDGMIYGVSSEDDIFVLEKNEVVRYFSKDDYDIEGVLYLLPDPDEPGVMYFGTDESTFYKGSIGDRITITDSIDISPLFGVMDIEKIGGRIWITGRNGIGVLDGRTFHFLGDLPLNNSVGSVMADYEGNLWFTSTRQGVMKLVPNQFANVFERFGIPEQVVNTTCMLDGNLYIGTDTGLLAAGKDELLPKVPVDHAEYADGEPIENIDNLAVFLDGCRIRSIIKDSKDRLWMSTWRAVGLVCYDHGNVTVFREQDGLISNHLRTVTEMSDGSILVAATGGANVIRDGKVTATYSAYDGIINPETLTVAEGANGDIILGSDGGGIYIINEEGTRCLSTQDGLSSGIILRIKKDPNRKLYWIVTSNSLAYMTEDYQVTTVRKFPYSNNFDLYENSKEEMWILSSNGIYVVPTEKLLANEEIEPVHYSMDNGLPCITTANSYSYLDGNGDLYIAGNSGVAKVNVETPLENVFDLRVSVPFVDADGERLYPDANGDFHLSSDVHKLTVYSYIFNFSLTNPTVMYRLDGFDSEDTSVLRSDLGPVDYTNLPGGTYRFVIKLKDSQGHTGKRVSVTIIKEKALYEETWFYVLIAAVSAGVLAALIRLYIKRKTDKLEQKHREDVRKERLNTELKTAGQIQESILPHVFPPFPKRKEFDIYASMTPAREVGGDFYDFFLIDHDHLGLVMADVSGKGIPASLFMMTSKAILQSTAMLGCSAAEILTRTNEALCSNNQVDMFVTIWVGILEVSTGKITAANAGHEYPAIMKNGVFRLLKDKHGFVVGGMKKSKYTEYEIQLEPGDKLFLYTDGVPEATDAQDNMFGTDRMLETLNKNADAAPKQILEEVRSSVDRFVKDAEQFDDLTMLCLEYRGTSVLNSEGDNDESIAG